MIIKKKANLQKKLKSKKH